MDEKTMNEIKELGEKCARLKAAKDMADKSYKKAKSMFETLCEENGIKSVDTDNYNVAIKTQKRFRGYRDEQAVYQMIPDEMKSSVTTLDRKKVNSLIDAGVLPSEIRDEEMYNEVTMTSFKENK